MKTSTTAESDHFFNTWDNSIIIEENQAKIYHTSPQGIVCHEYIKAGNSYHSIISKHASKISILRQLKEAIPHDEVPMRNAQTTANSTIRNNESFQVLGRWISWSVLQF